MKRREAIAVLGASAASLRAQEKLDLRSLPNFCSHEHWGSIDAIGRAPEGYRCDLERSARPVRPVLLDDLLFDPYMRGWVSAVGDPVQASSLPRQRLTGVAQCVRRGVQELHGGDEKLLSRRYASPFAWYREAMRKMHFSALIRPVHPEFYASTETPGEGPSESSFTRTVMRIDPMIEWWRQPLERRTRLARIAGVEPTSATSWKRFLDALFTRAVEGGAVGIKQLQAYRRPLAFAPVEDSAVRFTEPESAAAMRVFQDWIVHQCCRLANDRAWPHQIHVGTHNLAESSPLPLLDLARRYPRMKIVMIHCWPFLKEAGWLAKQTPNCYLDTCWQPILSPDFFRDAMREWLRYVPLHKITCGHDATSVEMAAGSALFTREILAESLVEAAATTGMSIAEQREIATGLLHGNAAALYGTG